MLEVRHLNLYCRWLQCFRPLKFVNWNLRASHVPEGKGGKEENLIASFSLPSVCGMLAGLSQQGEGYYISTFSFLCLE
jgi:hypothetical protein